MALDVPIPKSRVSKNLRDEKRKVQRRDDSFQSSRRPGKAAPTTQKDRTARRRGGTKAKETNAGRVRHLPGQQPIEDEGFVLSRISYGDQGTSFKDRQLCKETLRERSGGGETKLRKRIRGQDGRV